MTAKRQRPIASAQAHGIFKEVITNFVHRVSLHVYLSSSSRHDRFLFGYVHIEKGSPMDYTIPELVKLFGVRYDLLKLCFEVCISKLILFGWYIMYRDGFDEPPQ